VEGTIMSNNKMTIPSFAGSLHKLGKDELAMMGAGQKEIFDHPYYYSMVVSRI
jgi:hypothetical protein